MPYGQDVPNFAQLSLNMAVFAGTCEEAERVRTTIWVQVVNQPYGRNFSRFRGAQ